MRRPRRHPTDLWPDCLRDAERLARVIMPELGALPIYLLPVDELPDRDHALAFVGPFCCYDYRHLIEDWEGPGVCIVLNRPAIDRLRGRFDRFSEVVAITIHELGHIGQWLNLAIECNWPEPATGPPAPANRQEALASIRESVKMPTEPAAVRRNDAAHHPRDFGRFLIHLAHRAEKALGFPMPVSRCGYYPAHGYANLYADAIGDEPSRLIGLPLREILTISPPEKFIALCDEYDRHEIARMENET